MSTRGHRLGRWVAVVAMAAVVLVQFGVLPSPARLSKSLGLLAGERYPCEGGACGCASARECWTVCRCQPMSVKLAWAARQNVAVPEWVIASASASGSASDAAAGGCPLCHTVGSSESGSREASSLPTLSPAGCKGTAGLIAVALPAGVPARGVAWVPAVQPWSWSGPGEARPRLAQAARETPTPPPRAA